MTISVSVSELRQCTAEVLRKAVVDGQDVIVERYGKEYAVILSRERYQELCENKVALEEFEGTKIVRPAAFLAVLDVNRGRQGET